LSQSNWICAELVSKPVSPTNSKKKQKRVRVAHTPDPLRKSPLKERKRKKTTTIQVTNKKRRVSFGRERGCWSEVPHR